MENNSNKENKFTSECGLINLSDHTNQLQINKNFIKLSDVDYPKPYNKVLKFQSLSKELIAKRNATSKREIDKCIQEAFNFSFYKLKLNNQNGEKND